jgi:hypothetical protein
MIGRLLGHTQIGKTRRYAQLIDAPLRAGVNAVGEMLKPWLRVVGGVKGKQRRTLVVLRAANDGNVSRGWPDISRLAT